MVAFLAWRLLLMSEWCNRHRFSMDAGTELFNSVSRVPRELIDRNERIDYKKLRHLIKVSPSMN